MTRSERIASRVSDLFFLLAADEVFDAAMEPRIIFLAFSDLLLKIPIPKVDKHSYSFVPMSSGVHALD